MTALTRFLSHRGLWLDAKSLASDLADFEANVISIARGVLKEMFIC